MSLVKYVTECTFSREGDTLRERWIQAESLISFDWKGRGREAAGFWHLERGKARYGRQTLTRAGIKGMGLAATKGWLSLQVHSPGVRLFG